MIRIRPRFSLRALAILVTLVCLYFGAWEATKRYGIPQYKSVLRDPDPRFIARQFFLANSPTPFIIRSEEIVIDVNDKAHYPVRWYVWLGTRVRLPFETTWQRRKPLTPRRPRLQGKASDYE